MRTVVEVSNMGYYKLSIIVPNLEVVNLALLSVAPVLSSNKFTNADVAL
jgi:hypothetical protein